jgi:hypothetical protein
MLTSKVRIPRLLRIIGVVPHEKIPPEGGILGGKGMKDRDVIVIRQAGVRELHRVTTGFKKQHGVACLSQVRGHRPTTSS